MGVEEASAPGGSQEGVAKMGLITAKIAAVMTKWGMIMGIGHRTTFGGGKIAVRPGRQ